MPTGFIAAIYFTSYPLDKMSAVPVPCAFRLQAPFLPIILLERAEDCLSTGTEAKTNLVGLSLLRLLLQLIETLINSLNILHDRIEDL